MIETVNSRNWLTFLGAFGFCVGASLPWLVPAPPWARWVGAAFALLGVGFLYRLVVPIEAKLVVDEKGLRWWMGARQTGNVGWPEVRKLRQSSEDDSLSLDVGRWRETHIPSEFLRSVELQKEFLQLVSKYRPDLRIGKL